MEDRSAAETSSIVPCVWVGKIIPAFAKEINGNLQTLQTKQSEDQYHLHNSDGFVYFILPVRDMHCPAILLHAAMPCNSTAIRFFRISGWVRRR